MYYVRSGIDYPSKCLQNINVDRLKLITKTFKISRVVVYIMVHKVK